VPSFTNILIAATVLRIGLIAYSEWHDAHSVVKYTDVDYRVFSDAARFTLNPNPESGNVARGPLGHYLPLGDPYSRQTYRYTPLLALLLLPNEWIHASFGKFLFAACDIAAGMLIHKLLTDVILPPKSPPETRTKTATVLSAIHLLNPMVFAISTRGSSESVLMLFVLLTLYAAMKNRWDAAAILLGLSTHWKIYPFVYGIACLGVVGNGVAKGGIGRIVNMRTIRFGMLSAGTFVLLGTGLYLIWGYPFLFESYLYHLNRRDHRHNFSPYFYLAYLTYPSKDGSVTPLSVNVFESLVRSPLVSFVPQMGLSVATGLMFGRRKDDLPFAWFVQTVIFVLFNKVCTSQYFLWYLLFIPLLMPRLSLSLGRAGALLGVWIGTQALWLAEAFKLEFLGQNVFYGLWVRSLIYVVGNAWVLGQLMDSYGKR